MAEIKYKKPVITRVKLDPEQAVITSCQREGHYMANDLAATAQYIGPVGTGNNACDHTRKGAHGAGNTWDVNTWMAQPS